jgi:hypothetical protein
MKMSAPLYAELNQALRPYLHATSCTTMRQRWDMLWCAVDAGAFDIRKAYAEGLNDAHIDTALRHAFQRINLPC